VPSLAAAAGDVIVAVKTMPVSHKRASFIGRKVYARMQAAFTEGSIMETKQWRLEGTRRVHLDMNFLSEG